MPNQIEVRLTGSGGQGLILGGIILAEAALRDDKNAIQSQSYGPEARGGASKAEVIVSQDEIDFPKVDTPDLLLALTQVACDKYGKCVKENGILLIDSTVEAPKDIPSARVIKVPILSTANSVVGKPMVANIIALGVIQELLKFVSRESLENAVLSRVPPGTTELNKQALQEGYKLVSRVN